MEHRRGFPQMQRQRSSSDPFAAIPRRIVEQGDDKVRRGSMSSISTLVPDMPMQPAPAYAKAFAKDGREPRMEPEDSDADDDAPIISEMDDRSILGRLRTLWAELSGPLPLTEAPPSPEDPGLSFHHLRGDAPDAVRDEILDELKGHGPSEHKRTLLWRFLRPTPATWPTSEPKVRKYPDSADNSLKFLLNLANALHIYNFPSHRICQILEDVADSLDFQAQFVHSAKCIQVHYPKLHPGENISTRHATSLVMPTKMTLDLGRIQEVHNIYRDIVRDRVSAGDASLRLVEILNRKATYSVRLDYLLGTLQTFILCGTSFGGSILDMAISGALGFVVLLFHRATKRTQLSKSGTVLWSAVMVSFVARALSSSAPHRLFCYQAISSTGLTGMLPGSIMLAGVLDIANNLLELGSTKMVNGLLTSLMLGFGLTFGSDIWLNLNKMASAMIAHQAAMVEVLEGTLKWVNDTGTLGLPMHGISGIFTFTGDSPLVQDKIVNGCPRSTSDPWYMQPMPWYTLFALLPFINFVASIRRGVAVRSREMPIAIGISCASQAVTRVVAKYVGLNGHPDYTALIGSFVVSLLGNIYGLLATRTAFSVMLTGIWLLIPTGLAAAGGLSSTYGNGQDEYTMALDLARKMLSVIIGVMTGLYFSSRIVLVFTPGRAKAAFFTY